MSLGSSASRTASAPHAGTERAAVDCDFRVRPTLAAVGGDLPRAWREYYRIRQDGREQTTSAVGSSTAVWGGLLPAGLWGPPDPDTDPDPSLEEGLRQLDVNGIDRAIVNPGIAPRLTGLSNPRWAAELARATNRWVERRWLQHSERFLATLVVGARHPGLIAEEIRRAGTSDRVVQVAIGFPHVYLGDRQMYPVYEAAIECGLSILLQAGGAYTGSSRGFTGVGHPSHVYEADVGWLSAAQPHLTSLVAQGVFERYPELRLIAGGFGVAWLPSLIWQLDANFARHDIETPRSLTRRPSETIHANVRWTTERLEASIDHLQPLLSLIDGETLLVFGSGARGLETPPNELDEDASSEWRERLLRDNLRQLVAERGRD